MGLTSDSDSLSSRRCPCSVGAQGPEGCALRKAWLKYPRLPIDFSWSAYQSLIRVHFNRELYLKQLSPSPSSQSLKLIPQKMIPSLLITELSQSQIRQIQCLEWSIGGWRFCARYPLSAGNWQCNHWMTALWWL